MKMYRGGGLAHFDARKGNLGLFADLSYGVLGHSGTTNYGLLPLSVNFPVKDDIQCGILQVGGLYRLGTERLSFDGSAGVRYLYVKTHFAVEDAYVATDKDFIEPMFGGNLGLRLSDTWSLSARTSVSGFGLGSELTTDSEARISYKLSNRFNGYVGYRILDTEYHQKAGNLVKPGIGNNSIPLFTYKDINVTVECVIQGPVAGVELRW